METPLNWVRVCGNVPARGVGRTGARCGLTPCSYPFRGTGGADGHPLQVLRGAVDTARRVRDLPSEALRLHEDADGEHTQNGEPQEPEGDREHRPEHDVEPRGWSAAAGSAPRLR